MIRKIGLAILASVAVSTVSAVYVTLVSYYAYYPDAGTSYDSLYLPEGLRYTVEVTGVGGGSGNGHAYPAGGSIFVSTGAGGGAGQPFYSSVTSAKVGAGTYVGMASASTWSPGAYAITRVTADW